jgi:hypothetical protein
MLIHRDTATALRIHKHRKNPDVALVTGIIALLSLLWLGGCVESTMDRTEIGISYSKQRRKVLKSN